MDVRRVGQYRLGVTIGKGNFAKVKLAYHQIAKRHVAVKIVDKSQIETDNLLKIQREIQILKSLRHPNIIRLYEVLEDDSLLFIVTEYCSGGEIFSKIAEHGALSEEKARIVFSEIVSAVAYCHSRGVVHRDLKAENILLDREGSIRLIDFGFSNWWRTGDAGLGTWCGSPPYAAPELFLGQAYDGAKADVWSLGVVLFVLVSAGFPFPATSIERLKKAVLSGTFSIPFRISVECSDLIRKMLTVNPVARASIKQVIQHRWFHTESEGGKEVRERMRKSSESGPEPPPERLSDTVLVYLQQKSSWPASQISKSVQEQLFDSLHGAYSLLHEKLLRQASKDLSPELAARGPRVEALGTGSGGGVSTPRRGSRGSITQGTPSDSAAFVPIPASDFAKLNISSPDVAALSGEESETELPTIENPQLAPDMLSRLRNIAKESMEDNGEEEMETSDVSGPSTANRQHNPNRRHTLADALAQPQDPHHAFLLAQLAAESGVRTTPFPLESPLVALHMASIAAAGGTDVFQGSTQGALGYMPGSTQASSCFGVGSAQASLLQPYGQAWGRRASDNPALTAGLLAHLQGQLQDTTNAGQYQDQGGPGTGPSSDQASPSGDNDAMSGDDTSQLQSYLRGRGAGKRHTIGAPQSAFFLGANPFQLPEPPGDLIATGLSGPSPNQQLSPLSRERKRFETTQPYKHSGPERRRSENTADIGAASLAHLQSLYSQGESSDANTIATLQAEMEKLRGISAESGQLLGSSGNAAPEGLWLASSPRASNSSPNPVPPGLDSILEGDLEVSSPPCTASLPSSDPFQPPQPHISLTDTERGEGATQIIHAHAGGLVAEFQTEAARILGLSTVSSAPGKLQSNRPDALLPRLQAFSRLHGLHCIPGTSIRKPGRRETHPTPYPTPTSIPTP